MDKDIEDVVTSCQSCAAQRSLPPVAPLRTWPWASHPMQRIHIDFASIEQFQVLVIRQLFKMDRSNTVTVCHCQYYCRFSQNIFCQFWISYRDS